VPEYADDECMILVMSQITFLTRTAGYTVLVAVRGSSPTIAIPTEIRAGAQIRNILPKPRPGKTQYYASVS